jgi:myo-inositol-1(or 4)-monophosphatase
MVSDADRDAETAIADMLTAERPDDGLLAEEGGRSSAKSGRTWVVDPLDGTTNYLYGFPAWAVSIALEDDEGPLVGAVLDASRGELFSAARGRGGNLTGPGGESVPLQVSGCERLDSALVATGFSYEAERRAEQAEVLRKVIPSVRDIRRAGAASLDLCGVACGRLDGYYERGLQPWDWAAGRLLVTEAGGEVRDLPGEPHGLVAAWPGLIGDLATLVEPF